VFIAEPGGGNKIQQGALQTYLSGIHMTKMAIFLGGFLALTLLIGVLATISPV